MHTKLFTQLERGEFNYKKDIYSFSINSSNPFISIGDRQEYATKGSDSELN
jgi:hypothetical protein